MATRKYSYDVLCRILILRQALNISKRTVLQCTAKIFSLHSLAAGVKDKAEVRVIS